MARLEHRLQPVVNYGIMPVFALANARGAVAGLVAMRLACKPFREDKCAFLKKVDSVITD